MAVPTAAALWGRREARVPRPHVPGDTVAHTLAAGHGHGLHGGVAGAGAEGQAGGREEGQPVCSRASPPRLPNNGREGSGELGSAGDTTGHAPVACALLLPGPSGLPPAGTRLRPRSVPGPTARCPTALCPTAPCPTAPALQSSRPALPSQSFCFPSPEGKASEAQVSKVEKQFLPLQIAPVLLCFPIPAGSARPGWGAGAARRHRGGCPPFPRATRRARVPASSAGASVAAGLGAGAACPRRELPAPLGGSASANCLSPKLQLQRRPRAGGRPGAQGPSVGTGCVSVGSGIQLSRPGRDPDLSLRMASASAWPQPWLRWDPGVF